MEINNYIIDIKRILAEARTISFTAIHTAMVVAYWKVGERIVLHEQGGAIRAAYGEQLLKELSTALTAEFGRGFSSANLRNMRQFYLTYPEGEKCYALRSKLSWTHHRLIMRVENGKAREYYLREASANSWSSRLLERNIATFYYQRLLSSQNNSIQPINPTDQIQLEDFVKDPYILEFLNIEKPHTASEQRIESAIIDQLQHFLLELGKGFSFVGRQYRISSELEHYYVDLVFYNYILKCFILIDLKTSKLLHQDIDQMDMYRRMFDDLRKPDGDNPTIGIILCAEKSETVVKYSVINDNPQMFASKFMPYLPTEAEFIAEIERGAIERKTLSEYPPPMYPNYFKRVIDFAAALVALLLLLPLLLIVALWLRLANGASPFFFQARPGKGGAIFRVIKFKTMSDARDANGELLPDAERLTSVGKFVRSTSLDELPQLLNVLKGDMALVGPRPLLPQYLPLYSAEQARRHDVRPGITGWAQVNGRNAISWTRKFELDLYYVDHLTFGLDLRILLLTVKKVFVREGISQEGSATMDCFNGKN